MEDLSIVIKLLHSSAPDSAEKMRNLLNTEILKHYDKSKLIENHLTKKQIESLIVQENKAVGSNFKLKKHKTKKVEEIKIATTPIISENQQIIKSHDLDDSNDNSSDAMDLLTDLTCVSCRMMDNSANNQLFECIECHQLFHQLCHSTKIPNDANQNSWTCSNCKGKKEGSTKAKSYESSSSSSNSSSYKHKEKEKEREKEKEKEKEKSTTEKRKSEGSSSSSKTQKKSKESSSSSRSRSSKKSS